MLFFRRPTPALSDGYPTGSKLVENDFQVGQQMAVEISWFLNPVHFFLIPAGNADFRQLMETMQPDYPKRKSAELNSLSPGDFVVARAKDDVIYRAKIIQTRPGGKVGLKFCISQDSHYFASNVFILFPSILVSDPHN